MNFVLALFPIHLVYCQLGEWQHSESMNVLRDVLPYSTSDAEVGPEKVRYKVKGVEMKGMESSMKLVPLGATQHRG